MVLNSFVRIARCVVLSCLVWSAASLVTANAMDMNDITLSLSATTANAGDIVEVSLSLSTLGDSPETMIVNLAYDATALTPNSEEYELIVTNPVSNQPIRDDNGNVIVNRRAVRPSDGVKDAGFGFDSEVHAAEGVVGVVIVGQNNGVIPDGLLFTIAFTVAGDMGNGSTSEVIGLNDDNAIVIPDGSGGVAPATTSAARGDGGALTYGFEDVTIDIGCGPPEAPGGITASQSRNDGVFVQWSAVATPDVEYRVYRSTVNTPSSAIPVGAGWSNSLSYLDITAQVPTVVAGDGCTVPAQVEPVPYFYWVRARSASGCQGELSGASAEGFLAAAKSNVLNAGFFPFQGSRTNVVLYVGMLLFLLSRGTKNRGAARGQIRNLT